ncbi:hypothetical protein K439DRAFT_1621862 [Ramaria rubella]|nr:hypothetical protein K439DRAFT_1621862 [Ramaria rubella]
MVSCSQSPAPTSIIEISSNEEIIVEIKEMDWKKRVLEEKLHRKVKAKWERQEKEAAERQEEVRKQKEEDDWKRKEKEDEDWKRQEDADQQRWWEDVEWWKNESTWSVQEDLRREEAEMRKMSVSGSDLLDSWIS